MSPGCPRIGRTWDLCMLVGNGTGRIILGCLRICRTWDLCMVVCNGTGTIIPECPQDVSGYVGLGTCVC